jgi:DNA mismatch endonuclease (patch repair protein)
MTPDELRSRTMRAVKSKSTKPEMAIRRLTHALGFRFRLHRKDLPGSPDLVFPARRKVIFVHGCFWHGHDCPRGARVPKTNRLYWLAKIACNKARDGKSLALLAKLGWEALTIWECELQKPSAISSRISQFLGSSKASVTPPSSTRSPAKRT